MTRQSHTGPLNDDQSRRLAPIRWDLLSCRDAVTGSTCYLHTPWHALTLTVLSVISDDCVFLYKHATESPRPKRGIADLPKKSLPVVEGADPLRTHAQTGCRRTARRPQLSGTVNCSERASQQCWQPQPPTIRGEAVQRTVENMINPQNASVFFLIRTVARCVHGSRRGFMVARWEQSVCQQSTAVRTASICA